MLALPTELWQRIFKAAHSTAGYRWPPDPDIEIILGCVCRYWREVVHCTPDLWTIITLSPAKCDPILTEHYISRSAPLPLRLHMDFGRVETDFSKVWDLYPTTAARISHLSIRDLEMGPSYTEFWHRSHCIPFPKLKTLVISSIAPNILLDFFEAIHAPNLETVAISTSIPSPPQLWHPVYDNAPVDLLYVAYAQLDPNRIFQVPDSFLNVFSKVRDLGFIGTPRATPSQTLSSLIHHMAQVFPNVVSLHTDISISTFQSTFSASSLSMWSDLHYISFLRDIPTATNSTMALTLQESRGREGRPIHNIYLAGKR